MFASRNNVEEIPIRIQEDIATNFQNADNIKNPKEKS